MASADDIRKRSMESHLFTGDSSLMKLQELHDAQAAITYQNRKKDMQSQIQFGDDSQPVNQNHSHLFKPLPPLQSATSNSQIPQNGFQSQSIPNSLDDNRQKILEQKSSYTPSNLQPAINFQANFPAPHQARFISTPIKAAPLPKFNGLVQNTELPGLSPFPIFSIDDTPINADFHFHVKTLTSSGTRANKKLSSNASSEMAKMREEFKKDSTDFQGRISKIKPIQLIEPSFQMPPQDYIPPISSRSVLSTPVMAQ